MNFLTKYNTSASLSPCHFLSILTQKMTDTNRIDLIVNMSNGHLNTLGMIRESRLIAETWSLETNKAEPFLTLPE